MTIAHDNSNYTPMRRPITGEARSPPGFLADCLSESDVVRCTGSPEHSVTREPHPQRDEMKSRLPLVRIRPHQEAMPLLPIVSRDLALPTGAESCFMESWR